MRHLIILCLLVACGAEPTQTAAPVETAAQGGVQYQPDDPREVVVEYRKDGDVYALAVDDTADLPPCTREFSGKLAWIKKTEQFFSCADESWVEVDVRGAKGETGPIGPAGEKGEPGRPPSPNEWVDPITEERWFVGTLTRDTNLVSTTCINKWRGATVAELSDAMLHGFGPIIRSILGLGASADAKAWSSEFQYNGGNGAFERLYVSPASVPGTALPHGDAGAVTVCRGLK